MNVVTRTWIARCQYPGKAVFWIGTAYTARQEGVEAGRLAIEALIDSVLPTRPTILAVEPGAVFVSEDHPALEVA